MYEAVSDQGFACCSRINQLFSFAIGTIRKLLLSLNLAVLGTIHQKLSGHVGMGLTSNHTQIGMLADITQ
jgi:hypothetical protein